MLYQAITWHTERSYPEVEALLHTYGQHLINTLLQWARRKQLYTSVTVDRLFSDFVPFWPMEYLEVALLV